MIYSVLELNGKCTIIKVNKKLSNKIEKQNKKGEATRQNTNKQIVKV